MESATVPKTKRQHDRSDKLRRLALAGVLLALCGSAACQPPREELLTEIRELQVQNRYQETFEPLQDLLESDPEDPDRNRLYGLALYAADSPSVAVWALRKAAEDPEHSIYDLTILAQALSETASRRESLSVIDQVLAIEPDRLGALVLRTRLNLHLGNHEVALDSADRIRVLENRPEVHLWRARALTGLARYDEASEALAETRKRLTEMKGEGALQIPICEAEIEIAEQTEAGNIAADIWERCALETPADVRVLDAALRSLDEQGESDRALELLRTAFERTKVYEIRVRLSQRLESAEQPEEAEQLLSELIPRVEQPGPIWLSLSDLYRQRNEHRRAARAFETAFQTGQNAPIGLMAQYADDLLVAGEFDQAERVIESLEQPEYTLLLRGRSLLLQKKPAEALSVLEEGIRVWPSNGTARVLAAQAAEKLGDFSRAADEYRAAVRAYADEQVNLTLAQFYHEQGDDAAATFVLRTRLISSPSDEQANLELVRIFARRGAYPTAEETIDALREQPNSDRTILLASTVLAYHQEGPLAAAQVIREAKLDLTKRQRDDILRDLVSYLIEAHRPQEALEVAQAVSQADPDWGAFQEIHALALDAAGQSQESWRAHERALALSPNHAASLAGLARLMREAGHHESALAFFDRASASDPKNPEHAWEAIELLKESTSSAPRETESQSNEIDERLERLLYDYPRHAQAARERALRLLSSGEDLELANDLAQRAVRFSGAPETLETRGLVELARGEGIPALWSLRQSLELRPGSQSTLYQLAQAHMLNGNPEGARRALRQSLAGGDFPQAAAAREQLEHLVEESSSDEEQSDEK